MPDPTNRPPPPLPRHLKFWFEWGVESCLWSNCDHTREVFGIGPVHIGNKPDPKSRFETLLLSNALTSRIQALSQEHDTALNWDDPAGPLLWRQNQCDVFNAELDRLLGNIRAELGGLYTIIDTRMRHYEDPELDRYLSDPKGFRRK